MKIWLPKARILLIFVGLSVLLSSCTPAHEAVNEENLSLHTGDVYKARYVTWTDVDMKINTIEKKVTQNRDMTILMNVQEVDEDHNATIHCRYESIKSQSSVSIDGQPATDSFGNGLSIKEFSFKVNPVGDVIDIDKVNEISTQVVEAMPVTTVQKTLAETLMHDNLGDEDIKAMLSGLNEHLPRRTVHVGDCWEDTTTTKLVFPLRLNNKWKVTSDQGNSLSIEGNSTIITPRGEPSVEMTKAAIDATGNCKETLQWHKDNVLLRSRTTTAQFQGLVQCNNPENSSQTLIIPVTVGVKMNFEITQQ